MNTEQTEVNLLVVKGFDSLRISCFLGGSMASSVHGRWVGAGTWAQGPAAAGGR